MSQEIHTEKEKQGQMPIPRRRDVNTRTLGIPETPASPPQNIMLSLTRRLRPQWRTGKDGDKLGIHPGDRGQWEQTHGQARSRCVWARKNKA